MNFLTRYWKTWLLFIANTIFTYVEHDNLVNKAVQAEVPVDYQAIVMKHMQRAIAERETVVVPVAPAKFPAPYFYIPGKGQLEVEKAANDDFRKTYAYNAKVDAVMQRAGLQTKDTYSQLMENRYADTSDR